MECKLYYRNAAGELKVVAMALSDSFTMPAMLKDLSNQEELATYISKQLGLAVMLPILAAMPNS